MLELLRGLRTPLIKLALALGVIAFLAAFANDLISGIQTDALRIGRHALAGLVVGMFASLLLGLIAVGAYLLIGRQKD